MKANTSKRSKANQLCLFQTAAHAALQGSVTTYLEKHAVYPLMHTSGHRNWRLAGVTVIDRSEKVSPFLLLWTPSYGWCGIVAFLSCQWMLFFFSLFWTFLFKATCSPGRIQLSSWRSADLVRGSSNSSLVVLWFGLVIFRTIECQTQIKTLST